ncbi:MAG: A24 family peptidase [Candidatus Woesearchaeota archaeon]
MNPYFEILLCIFGLFMLILASIEDFKKREVYDLISYSLIAIPLISRIFYSITSQNLSYFIATIIPVIFATLFGFFMYYTNQWGGGDVKVLIGIAATIPFFPIFANNEITKNLLNIINIPFKNNLFFYSFLIISFFEGAILGLIYGIYSIVKEKEKSSQMIIDSLKKHKFEQIAFTIINLFFLLTFLITKEISYLLLFFSIFLIQFLLPLIFTIEQLMIKEVTPKELTEGDWIIEDIFVDGKLFYSKKQPGVELNQIERLVKLYEDGIINTVKIKIGFPFVPAFLFSYITIFIIFVFL